MKTAGGRGISGIYSRKHVGKNVQELAKFARQEYSHAQARNEHRQIPKEIAQRKWISAEQAEEMDRIRNLFNNQLRGQRNEYLALIFTEIFIGIKEKKIRNAQGIYKYFFDRLTEKAKTDAEFAKILMQRNKTNNLIQATQAEATRTYNVFRGAFREEAKWNEVKGRMHNMSELELGHNPFE